MTTMTIDQLFPLRRKDVLSVDTQNADGSVGSIQIVKLPTDVLNDIAEPANNMEEKAKKAQRLGALIVHTAGILRTPSHYLHTTENYDFLNPFSPNNVENFLDYHFMENMGEVLKKRMDEIVEGKKVTDMYAIGYTTNSKFISALLGYAPSEFDLDSGTVLVSDFKKGLKHKGEDEFTVTQYHFLDGELTSMNLSPFHSTDFREYNPFFNLDETDVDPQLTQDMDDELLNTIEETFDALGDVVKGLDDVDPQGLSEKLLHGLLGQLNEKEQKSFLTTTLMKMGAEVREGDVQDVDLMSATIDAFIERVRGDEDFPLDFNDPIGQFSEEVLKIGRSKRRIYHVRLTGHHEKEMFVFSDCETSLGFSLHHTDDDAKNFVIPENHILELSQGVNLSGLEDLEARSKERFNRRIPLSEIEGIIDATEKIGHVLVHSLVISFFAAMNGEK